MGSGRVTCFWDSTRWCTPQTEQECDFTGLSHSPFSGPRRAALIAFLHFEWNSQTNGVWQYSHWEPAGSPGRCLRFSIYPSLYRLHCYASPGRVSSETGFAMIKLLSWLLWSLPGRESPRMHKSSIGLAWKDVLKLRNPQFLAISLVRWMEMIMNQ